MEFTRPDLNGIPEEVRAYIDALEAELERVRQSSRERPRAATSVAEVEPEEMEDVEPSEPPTSIHVITATISGTAKRTPRHYYTRQRRGGMGIFDLDAPHDEPPAVITLADEHQSLLMITTLARAFRLPVSAVKAGEVRDRGASLFGRLELGEDERLAALLPVQAQGYVAMVSQRGGVRMLRHHVFGEHMKPGAPLYDVKVFGPLASACWTPGDSDLFIATRQGKAIRFSEKTIPPQGGQGIRLSDNDQAVAITSVYENSGVFLLSADGKGAIRLMEGFSANKAPGAGGKIALNTDHLITALSVDEKDDIFIISRLSKIIRFPAGHIPPKEGVVQGVICMSLRGDEPAAAAAAPLTNSY
jgi:DNA gyrase subunit A